MATLTVWKFPTATGAEQALVYVDTRVDGCVVKATGLCAGKGVVVAQTIAEADDAIATFEADLVCSVAPMAERDHCIGCGLCERNCPYGSIHMVPRETPNLAALAAEAVAAPKTVTAPGRPRRRRRPRRVARLHRRLLPPRRRPALGGAIVLLDRRPPRLVRPS